MIEYLPYRTMNDEVHAGYKTNLELTKELPVHKVYMQQILRKNLKMRKEKRAQPWINGHAHISKRSCAAAD